MAATRFDADGMNGAARGRRRDAAHFALREGGGAIVRGVVRDRTSGAPVAGVIVVAVSGSRRVSATTAADGSYALEVETGAWTLTFDVGWGVITRRPEPAARGWVRIVNQVVEAGMR
ncbi:MAG: carboxypeptidase regulatory-like domain-containing protein [Myxococcales bacterium]|nr:carboxypeptidase regulatory-like domain-containing protein [Myxococcales bacterium]